MNEEWEDDIEKSDEDEEAEMFPFLSEEKAIVDETIALTREVLRLSLLTPGDIHLIAKLLLGLSRLPQPTPGINLGMTISYHFNDEMTYREIFVGEEMFRLTSGGSIYSPEVGSDTYSSIILHMEIGGYRVVGDWSTISGWIENFRELLNMSPRISFEDLGGDDVDWDIEAAEDSWDKLNEKGE